MPYAWEGNRRSSVALTMCHRLKRFSGIVREIYILHANGFTSCTFSLRFRRLALNFREMGKSESLTLM